MNKWIIALAAIVLLVSIGILVFRERPLISDGYVIDEVHQVIIDDELATDITRILLDPGSSHIEYNPSYPSDYERSFLSLDTIELEAILRTARCRLSFGGVGPYFTGDVKYRVFVTLVKGNSVRLLQLYLGTNNWESGGRFRYTILNADELITALDTAESIERVY